MRLSTLQFFQQNLQTFTNAESRLQQLQNQIATGVGVTRASDNPEAFITALKAQDSITRSEQYNRNINLVRLRFEQQETALGSANDILNAVRDAALQARTGTASSFDREILAADVRARKSELVAVLNTRDIDGLYIFGGGDQQAAPLNSFGNFNGFPSGNASNVDIAEGRTISTGFDPLDAFRSKVNIGYYTGGSNTAAFFGSGSSGSVVDLVENLAQAIERGDIGEIDRVTAGIEQNNNKLLLERTKSGTQSRKLDEALVYNDSQILRGNQIKDEAVGADLSKTITELTQVDTQLRALRTTYSQITRNSLFDLI